MVKVSEKLPTFRRWIWKAMTKFCGGKLRESTSYSSKKKEKKKLAEILMCWLGSAAVPAGNAPVYNQNIIK